MTPFEEAIDRGAARRCEPGEVVTYGEVALEAGRPGRGPVRRARSWPAPAARTRGGGWSTRPVAWCPGHEAEQARRLRAGGRGGGRGAGAGEARRTADRFAAMSIYDHTAQPPRRHPARPPRLRGQGAPHRERGLQVRAHPAVRGAREAARAVRRPGLLRPRRSRATSSAARSRAAPRRSPRSAPPPTASPSRWPRRSR